MAVTWRVSDGVYNVNSWILNGHVQFSVVVPEMFVFVLCTEVGDHMTSQRDNSAQNLK